MSETYSKKAIDGIYDIISQLTIGPNSESLQPVTYKHDANSVDHNIQINIFERDFKIESLTNIHSMAISSISVEIWVLNENRQEDAHYDVIEISEKIMVELSKNEVLANKWDRLKIEMIDGEAQKESEAYKARSISVDAHNYFYNRTS